MRNITQLAEHPVRSAGALLKERYRCPDDAIADFIASPDLHSDPGYFRLGPDTVCFGRSRATFASRPTMPLDDLASRTSFTDGVVRIEFDPVDAINNLRHERYAHAVSGRSVSGTGFIRRLYYWARPFMHGSLRKHLQRLYLRGWDSLHFPRWPVDLTVEDIFERLLMWSMKAKGVDQVPFVWFWPDSFKSCAVITHDVETTLGMEFCQKVMEIDESFGIASSFQIVPEERYVVSENFLASFRSRGFEINVQDLNHDGLLFSHPNVFLDRVRKINRYASEFGARGFRAAVLYRNAEWFDKLNFLYDTSVPNVAHLDPQRGGCCTVFPFYIGNMIELPVTAIQDYSLFRILNEYSFGLWSEQISTIRERHGFMNFIIHPDYIIEEKEQRLYRELLDHLSRLRGQGETWIPTPGEVADWWGIRNAMKLVKTRTSWRIEGPGSERARLAWASIADGRLSYRLETDRQ